MRRPPRDAERGTALLLALVVLVLGSTAGLLVAVAVALDHRGHREEVVRTRLGVLVDSALAEALGELRTDPSSQGLPAHPFADGEIGSEIRSLDASHRRIHARARFAGLEGGAEADVELTALGPLVTSWRATGTGPARP